MTVHYMHHSGSPSAFRPMKWCTTYTILTCLLSRHRQNGALHAPFWLTFSLSAHEMVYHVRHSDLFAVPPSTKWCTTCTILACSPSRQRQNGAPRAPHAPFWPVLLLSDDKMVHYVHHTASILIFLLLKRCTARTIMNSFPPCYPQNGAASAPRTWNLCCDPCLAPVPVPGSNPASIR